MNWMLDPNTSALATVWFGEAPTSAEACDEAETISPGHCDTFHATDEAYFDKVALLEHASRGLQRRGRSDDLQGRRGLDRGLDRRSRAAEPIGASPCQRNRFPGGPLSRGST